MQSWYSFDVPLRLPSEGYAVGLWWRGEGVRVWVAKKKTVGAIRKKLVTPRGQNGKLRQKCDHSGL